jgi:hypothetical protein
MDADAGADRLAPFEPKNDVKDFCLGGAILAWNERLSVASRDLVGHSSYFFLRIVFSAIATDNRDNTTEFQIPLKC